MSEYVIATTKSWNIENARKLKALFPNENIHLITKRNELTVNFLKRIAPRYVFFPHWSWIIPQEIFDSYECVVFHMTDLPFGRGGSPLQNLIVRGIYETKISAIRVEAGLDEGPVYLKWPVDISTGNADEILSKVSRIIFDKMIPAFITEELTPLPQEGDTVTFKRRSPELSEIPDGLTQRQVYDYIRMLDGEGYPAAYKDAGNVRIYFRNAWMDGEKVCAEVSVTVR